MILRKEVIQGQVIPAELEPNLTKLLMALNHFRAAYGRPMNVTSGYRSPEHNKAIGGALKSSHLTCEACDFADPTGELDAWVDAHPQILEQCGLWREHPDSTKSWIHLQIRPIKTGNRTFRP